MIKNSVVLLLAALLMPCSISLAQSSPSAYGSGVHQYFNGRYQEAIMSFNSAIAENPNDARAFYFRGLAEMASGDTYSADSDFQQGASLETSSNKGRSSLVNRSLERIQGTTRIRLEKFRGNIMSTPASAIAGYPIQNNQIIAGQTFVSQPFEQPCACNPQFTQQPVYQQPLGSQVYVGEGVVTGSEITPSDAN